MKFTLFVILTIALFTILSGGILSTADSEISQGENRVSEHSHPDSTTAALTQSPMIHLPETVGKWIRPTTPEAIDRKTIFDYMDGAGELYVGYRFDHLDMYEYTSEKQDNILVELYWMKTSDDAFGLLSTDWEGEAIDLSQPSAPLPSLVQVPSTRALYGSGLLRLWSDTCYARIMAYRETAESKEAVLEIGRAIVQDRKTPPPPSFLQILASSIGSEWILRPNRVCYFRSHLVLNSIFYVSSQNILNLDPTCEVLYAPYENKTDPNKPQRIRVLAIRYPDAEQTQKALARFHEAYFPEFEKKPVDQSTGFLYPIYPIEDGWTGYFEWGRYAVIVFESPDSKIVQTLLKQMEMNIKSLEENHGE